MNYLALWEHALDHLRHTDPGAAETLARWRAETPAGKTDRDLLEEYGWVVACCGLTAKAVMPCWDRLGAALGGWDPAAAAAAPPAVPLGVLGNRRKIAAIQQLAADLAAAPGQMARLAALPLPRVLAWLGTLPFVGPNNRHHLARNLGWDTAVRSGPVPRLAAALGFPDGDALCAAVAPLVGERLRVVDLVLWQWGHGVGDAEMHRWLGIFRMM